jgi:protein ImuB
MIMRRIACISLPRWPTDRLTRTCFLPETHSGNGEKPFLNQSVGVQLRFHGNETHSKASQKVPFATTARTSGGVRLIALNRAAQEAGLSPGMMLAGAKALVPDLVVADSDPAAEAADLLALVRWCMRWTPYCAPAKGLEGTHALFLDISGCAHLFGGEADMLADMLRRMRALGLTARAACAPTPGAAFALARFAGEAHSGLSAPDGTALRDLIAALPVEGLRIRSGTASGLRALGLKTIGALAGQSSAALARRFGVELVRALDRARGF